MKTVGFVIGHKENEKRRAILPNDAKKIANKSYVYIEKGYGSVLGIQDSEYISAGVKIATRAEALSCDIICDPKIGDADYLSSLNHQTVFGWVHAIQNKDISDKIVNQRLTAYAWEDMYEENRHVFWRNNELAGEAAVMDAFRYFGKMPYECKVAIIGRGNVAQGALKILTLLGADVRCYGRKTEKLLCKELSRYDVIVNAILWDTHRTDHIIYNSDVVRMKQNSLVIDISCDKNGGIEFSTPTTISEPVYIYDHVMVYAVDHTPSLFYKTVSSELSALVIKYVDLLIEEKENNTLKECKIIDEGEIIDKRITEYQLRHASV